MLIIVIGKNKTCFLREKINTGAVVFDNFGGDLHPTEIEKLIHNLRSLPVDTIDIYLGTNSYTVVKTFYIFKLKNKCFPISILDADLHDPTNTKLDCNSLIDFSINLYKQYFNLV